MSGERVLSARLEIEATDKTGKAFAEIERKVKALQRLQKQIQQVEGLRNLEQRAASTSASIDRVTRAMGKLADAQKQIENSSLKQMSSDFDHVAASAERAGNRVKNSLDGQNRRARELRSTLKEVGHLTAIGAGVATVKTYHEGAEYSHQETALKNAGRTPEEMVAIKARAQQVATAVPSSSVAQNLEVINETTGAFGSVEHALENLEYVQKMNAVLESVTGGKLGSAKDLGYATAKFAEMRGSAGNHEQFVRESGELLRAYAFYGGRANPIEMYNFASQAQVPLRHYSERFISRVVPTLTQVWGGEKAGTRANAFANVIDGKARDKQQAEAWIKLGLLDKKKVRMSAGHAISWQPGAVKSYGLAGTDPDLWFKTVVLPAARAKGLKVDDPNSDDLKKLLAMMFRNGEANRYATELADPKSRGQIEKDEALINKAGTRDEVYARNVSNDPTAAIHGLTGAMDTFMQILSNPIMDKAAKAMDTVARSIAAWSESMANWQKENPQLAETLSGGLLVGGATAGALGSGAVGLKLLKLLSGGGSAEALNGSAAALSSSAAALDAAAAKLAAGGAAGTAGKVAGAAGGVVAGGTVAGTGSGAAAGGTLAGSAGLMGLVAAFTLGRGGLKHMTPEEAADFRNFIRGGRGHKNGEAGDSSPDASLGNQLPIVKYPPYWLDDQKNDKPKSLSQQIYDEQANLNMRDRKDMDVLPDIKSALSGAATITVQVEPSRDFITRIVDMVKQEMSGFSLSGPGSTGQSSPDVSR